jgi:hypothetical protein
MRHFISASCQGERCSICGEPATHKVGEELAYDDPDFGVGDDLTAYVCCIHFVMILGPAETLCAEVDKQEAMARRGRA